MGEQITFRPRGRGCAVQLWDGAVSITEPRLKFIKGWLTGGTDPEDGSVECGDGVSRGYTLEVTKDELIEIMYRVKDAVYVSGEFTFEGVEPYWDPEWSQNELISSNTIKFGSTTPPVKLVEMVSGVDSYGAESHHCMRGHHTSYQIKDATDTGAPQDNLSDALLDSIFEPMYEVGTALEDSFSVGSDPYEVYGKLRVRDTISMGGSEYIMWLNVGGLERARLVDTLPTFENHFGSGDPMVFQSRAGDYNVPYHSVPYPSSFRTGFSLQAESNKEVSQTPQTFYAPYQHTIIHPDYPGEPTFTEYYGAGLGLEFSGNVGWVDGGTGHPFGAGSRLFIQVDFVVSSAMETDLDQEEILLSNVEGRSIFRNKSPADTRLVLELSEGRQVSCPLYFATIYLNFYIDYRHADGGVDWVFKATKWWEYDDGKGNPIYKSTTGKRI